MQKEAEKKRVINKQKKQKEQSKIMKNKKK